MSLGHCDKVMDALADGIAHSVFCACNNLQRGSISVAEELLCGTNID